MNNSGMSPLGTKAVVRTKRGDLIETTAVACQLIHSKPILTATLQGQDEKQEWFEVDIHFQIDPRKKRPEHANRIEAVQQRINAATRMIEKFAAASGQIGERKTAQVRREDLPDTDILVELLTELDNAMDAQLLDLVVVNGQGQTMWDYQDENGNFVNLTAELLRQNVYLAERLQVAFKEWNSFTRVSSEADTKGKTANGTRDLTTKTPNPSSSDSDTPSTALASSETTVPAEV